MKKHYNSWDEIEEHQQEIVDWLFSNANIICWTNYPDNIWQKLGLTSWEKNFHFAEMFEKFRPHFIRKTVDDLEYGNQYYKGGKIFSHYFFKIEGTVKDYINKEGPIASGPGFWDPIYYKDKYMIANTIGQEGMINIFE
ncbi:MAG: hypothetical protein WCG48_02860 [Candidatus Berkelbacteria bacterium]